MAPAARAGSHRSTSSVTSGAGTGRCRSVSNRIQDRAGTLRALSGRVFEQAGQRFSVARACVIGQPAADVAEHGAGRLATRLVPSEVLRDGRSRTQACVPGAQRRQGGGAGEILLFSSRTGRRKCCNARRVLESEN
jgi:hypothetical protein